ncbi:MAG: malate synthase A [Archangiaceae bacterium]|nr:malate synthase A [Archangiaceae bacterium]
MTASPRLQIQAAAPAGLLSSAAIAFLEALESRFGETRRELLGKRHQAPFAFLTATAEVRDGGWKVSPVPDVLADRRVEITGPAEPKMIINALNSGANVFMADFEDSLAPSWANLVEGQLALQGAVRKSLTWQAPDTQKQYRLNEKIATLFVRPRGWHLEEAHALFDGKPMSASLFDFGLFFFHNALECAARKSGPFFYLPKIESHLEARLWNDVFLFAEQELGIDRGTTKATVLIETLPAAFEMHEILYELREHSAGLNCGRWDYMFSFLKKQPDVLLPDRSQLTMDRGFLRAYTQLLIQTCHRRGAHAMGGMAAQIPIKDDPAANDAAMAKVRADKLREVTDGHDGTWVAHPALVPLAKAIFDEHMKTPNQVQRTRDDVKVGADDLLKVPDGTRTDEGLRHNVRVGVRYLEAWLRGQGCVPLYNLMEDAATAEISRAQVWQQVHVGLVSEEKLDQVMREELAEYVGGCFSEARTLFRALSLGDSLDDFLTIPAYRQLLHAEAVSQSSPSKES